MNSTALEPKPNLLYAAIFGSILTLGLPLNAVSLWILLRRHRVKSSNIVFMVNLAISDLLMVISLPMRVYEYATASWPLSTTACIVITTLFQDNIYSSTIFITFISVDRLLAVVYPLRSRFVRTACNAWKSAAIAWLFVILTNIPEYLSFQDRSNNGTGITCFQFSVNFKDWKIQAITICRAVSIFILLSVNLVCTAMVFWTLCKNLPNSAKVQNKVNVMLIFVLCLVMFIVCFLPLTIRILTVRASNLKPFLSLASANCCLDPLLYYFSFDGFWKEKEDADPARIQVRKSEQTVSY